MFDKDSVTEISTVEHRNFLLGSGKFANNSISHKVYKKMFHTQVIQKPEEHLLRLFCNIQADPEKCVDFSQPPIKITYSFIVE